MMRWCALVLPLWFVLPACGSDGPSDSAGGTESSGTEESSSGPGDSTGAETSTTDPSDTSDSNDDGPPTEPPPATGIRIIDVTADQGTRIPIVLGGQLVEGGQRVGALLKDRPILLRAFWEVEPGYETREILATLKVEVGGETIEHSAFTSVFEDDCGAEPKYECLYGSLINSFNWRLPADQVQPDTRYSIEMVESSPGHEDDPQVEPNFPEMPIGIEDSYMTMRVVVVPFYHNQGGNCPEAPDLSQTYGTDYGGNPLTFAESMAERLQAMNPADTVEVIPHDVVSFGGSMQGGQLLNVLQQLRFSENAPPEQYYYGVARPCDGGPSFSGVAQLGGPTKGEANQRVGWGVWYTANLGATISTFVHEIGHEQGLRHIACSGGEAGPDSSYPDHPEGDTVSFGADVYDNPIAIHPPTDHDYMSYCGDAWVSQWTWLKVFPWIQIISSWELEGPPAPKDTVLVGYIGADGTEDWVVAKSYFDPAQASADTTVRFFAGSELVAETPAVFVPYEKSNDMNLIVSVPDDFERLTAIEWDHDGQTHAIDRTKVRRIGSQ